MELHTSPLGGHSGFLKTYHRVKKELKKDFEMTYMGYVHYYIGIEVTQRWLGMDKGCNRPGVLIVSTLFCWQTKLSATNF